MKKKPSSKKIDEVVTTEPVETKTMFNVEYDKEKKLYMFKTYEVSEFTLVSEKKIGDSKARATFEIQKMLAHDQLLPKEQ